MDAGTVSLTPEPFGRRHKIMADDTTEDEMEDTNQDEMEDTNQDDTQTTDHSPDAAQVGTSDGD